MLKNKIVEDKEMQRIYVCLALVDGFLVPTSQYPKIVKEHVEMAEDMNFFLSYPWVRLSFEMMMKSIKERDVEQLATTCVVVQGLLYALQLVILQAAPAIQEGSPSEEPDCSDSDGGPVADVGHPSAVPLKIANARRLGCNFELLVDPIICPDLELENEDDLPWEDDSEDPAVDNSVSLAPKGFLFSNDMFTGGCIPSQLELAPKKQKRGVKDKISCARKGQIAPPSQPACSTAQRLSSGAVSGLTGTCNLATMSRLLDSKLVALEDRIIKGVTNWFLKNPNIFVESARTLAKEGSADKQAAVPPPPAPTVNGVNETQTALDAQNVIDPDIFGNSIMEILKCYSPNQTEVGVVPSGGGVESAAVDELTAAVAEGTGDGGIEKKLSAVPGRRSKRLRTFSTKLDGWFQYDKKTKVLVGHPSPVVKYPNHIDDPEERSISIGGEASLSVKDVLDIIERKKHLSSKVMDALIKFSRHLLQTEDLNGEKLRVDLLDSKFFSKSTAHAKFKFPGDIVAQLVGSGESGLAELFTEEADFLYAPFNFDRKHWVSLCIDLCSTSIVVLDSNTQLPKDHDIFGEIQPFAPMLPYLLIQAGVYYGKRKRSTTPFSITRPSSIPQVKCLADSGIMSIFLIHAHATGGLEECGELTVEQLDPELKKFVYAIILASVE
ncbi:hypothetical protein CARUB_v10007889mg [Capsella rubella]|uniref:Ubiquitin-like protease family profile domain-containing protein n=1 Tax=Capsella rubella TaxID=81985 RepID=R0GMC4_9BRAS|nr:hypothetical protein CARUB_v10007889mg [Capsella rubella]